MGVEFHVVSNSLCDVKLKILNNKDTYSLHLLNKNKLIKIKQKNVGMK